MNRNDEDMALVEDAMLLLIQFQIQIPDVTGLERK